MSIFIKVGVNVFLVEVVVGGCLGFFEVFCEVLCAL